MKLRWLEKEVPPLKGLSVKKKLQLQMWNEEALEWQPVPIFTENPDGSITARPY